MGGSPLPQRRAVFPEDVINELIQLSVDHSQNAWRLGDFIIIQMANALSLGYDKREVRATIAEISKLDMNTVRDRERISRKIPPCDREYEPLLYSQYRACMAAGDKWKDYAEWAVSSMADYGGNPPSVAVIRAKIKSDNNSAPEWPRKVERMITLCDSIINDKKTPERVSSEVQNVRLKLLLLSVD